MISDQLPIVRYAAVTKITKLGCAVCTRTWQIVDFPDHTRPRTLFCPWCRAEQVYPADKPSQFCEKDTDILMDINASSLTTRREREAFTAVAVDFINHDLLTAPREQLQDIERVMRYWRPTADHRK